MYGLTRLAFNNQALTNTIASLPSEGNVTGVFTAPIKHGSGSAGMVVSGTYDGSEEHLIEVYISDVSSGKEIGQAKYNLKVDGVTLNPLIWQKTTSASDTDTLYGGLHIRFTAGTGNDFESGDAWTTFAVSPYCAERLNDERRDTIWRVNVTANNVTAQTLRFSSVTLTQGQPYLLAMFDCLNSEHFTVEKSLGASLAERTTLTRTAENVCYTYFTPTDDYTRLDILLFNETDNDLIFSCSQVYLGEYLELPREGMPWWGSKAKVASSFLSEKTTAINRAITANVRSWDLTFQNLSNTNTDNLRNMFLVARSATDGKEHPVYLHEFSDTDRLFWTRITSDFDATYDGVNLNSVALQFEEVTPGYVV